MKITAIDIFILKPAFAERPFPVKPVICRVYTEEGIYGVGEAGIAAGVGVNAAVGMLRDLAPCFLGQDIAEFEAIAHTLKNSAYGHVSGGGAVFSSALSAYDTAYFDIKGKQLGIPAWQLLGGRLRDHVDCYASQVHDGWGTISRRLATAEDYAEATRIVCGQGFKAGKYNLSALDREGNPIPLEKSTNPAYAHELANLARERLDAVRAAGGESFGIIGESLSRMAPSTAAAVDKVCAEYQMLYMEEPYFSYDARLYSHSAERFRVGLACGEKLHNGEAFLPYFESRSITVAQPDVAVCSGLREAKRICDTAALFGISVQPHICGSPIAYAATLQLEAVVQNFVMHECLCTCLEPEWIEYGQYDLSPQHAVIAIPDRPGIGQDLSERAVKEAQRIHLE